MNWKRPLLLPLLLLGPLLSAAASGQNEASFEAVVRPEHFGNEPFTTVCLVTESGDVYAVHPDDRERAEALESFWYQATLRKAPKEAPPPGIACKAVVRLESIKRK